MPTPTTLPAAFTTGQVLTSTAMNNLRGAFRVLQVVQTVKTDTFATASLTYVDVTGLSATITPSATSNKVLVVVQTQISAAADGLACCYLQVIGGNSGTYIGDAAGNRVRSAYGSNGTIARIDHLMMQGSIIYVDSPNTTSATTYKVQMRNAAGSLGATLNRTYTDTDTAGFPRCASSITVMEVSA